MGGSVGQSQQNTATNQSGQHHNQTGTAGYNSTVGGGTTSSNTAGSNTSNTSGTSTTNPWAVQSPYLQDAFAQAQAAMRAAQGAATPNQFVAGFDPRSIGIFKKMMGSAGDRLPDTTGNTARDLMTRGAAQGTDALRDLGLFRPQGDASTNIAAATAYANNPAVGGMIDSAMRDAERSAAENIRPAIMRGAAATGNVDGSKTAIRQGLVDRGLAEKRADIGADLRGRLFSEGLQMAEGARQFDNNSSLNALVNRMTGGTAAASAGVNAGNASVGQRGSLFDIANQGITGARAAGQAGIDNSLDAWKFGQNAPFAAINNAMNIFGGQNWGSSTSTTGSQTGTSTGSQSGQSTNFEDAIRALFVDDKGTSSSTGTSNTTSQASPAAIIAGLMGGVGSMFPKGFGFS